MWFMQWCCSLPWSRNHKSGRLKYFSLDILSWIDGHAVACGSIKVTAGSDICLTKPQGDDGIDGCKVNDSMLIGQIRFWGRIVWMILVF